MRCPNQGSRRNSRQISWSLLGRNAEPLSPSQTEYEARLVRILELFLALLSLLATLTFLTLFIDHLANKRTQLLPTYLQLPML